MKKLALTSLMALFAVSSANAATNYFVGGSADFGFDSDHENMISIAPELGWKVDSKWDLGLMAEYDYDRDSEDHESMYGIGAFARYKVAEFGGFNLLVKGTVAAGFIHEDGETAKMIYAEVAPMVTYDISERFTLYADLNFLGVDAGYVWANDKMGVEKGWFVNGEFDSDNVLNTGNFKIGFNYNF